VRASVGLFGWNIADPPRIACVSQNRVFSGPTPTVYSFFKHENEFYRVKKGDLLEALQWSAQETEIYVRLGRWDTNSDQTPSAATNPLN
jgi:hypothetical protein